MTPSLDPSAVDSALVSRMARGDRGALAELYNRHSARLLALAERILGDRIQAEDLLHDVFLEAWRHAEDYSTERGTVSAWLGLRTRSRAIDQRRASPRSRSLELGETILRELSDPEADPTRTSDRSRLYQALGSMSEEEQVVIVLGYFEGLTSSEIAQRTGSPIGTVKSRTRNALTKLRAFFGESGAA
jgi:RNA polymerase sigma-70 factor (ECF subfamily)